jgi:heat shock protein HslJ
MRYPSLCVAGLLLLLQAPGGTRAAAQDAGVSAATGLEGKRWAWEGFTAPDAGPLVPAHPENYWLEFLPHGQLAIQADCNRATGKWTVEGAALHLTPLAMTLMACPEESLDGRFLALLQRTTHFRRRGRTLRLELDGPSAVLRFTALAADAGPSHAP